MDIYISFMEKSMFNRLSHIKWTCETRFIGCCDGTRTRGLSVMSGILSQLSYTAPFISNFYMKFRMNDGDNGSATSPTL